jgi:hypothetical protein
VFLSKHDWVVDRQKLDLRKADKQFPLVENNKADLLLAYQIWGFDKMSIRDENLAGASFVVIDRVIGLMVQNTAGEPRHLVS